MMDILSSGGKVRAFVSLHDGLVSVHLSVLRVNAAQVVQAASVIMTSSCGGAFWYLASPEMRNILPWASPLPYHPGSSDLLPGEAFSHAADQLDRRLSAGAWDPLLSEEERDSIASLPGILKGAHSALVVMLS